MSTPEDPRALAHTNSLQSGAEAHEPDMRADGTTDASSRSGSSYRERAKLRLERAEAQALAAANGSVASESGGDLLKRDRGQEPELRTETAPSRPGSPRGPNGERRILELRPLPQKARKRSIGVLISFVACVLLPVVAASVYYFAYASDQYAAEFSFVVRDAKSAAAGTSTGSMPNIMGMFGGSSNSVENYMVAEYLRSRMAVQELQQHVDLVQMYSRPETDWLARLDPSAPMERIVPYWRRMVTASYDQITGLGVAQIRAFTAQDAYAIATTLVKLSEQLVNQVANRPQLDAVRFAEEEVKRAEDRLLKIRAELTQYRNTEMVIEPQADSVTGKITVAQTLRANVASLETEISILKSQNVSPNAPQVVTLTKRLEATRTQLRAVESQVATARDGNTPLSKVVGEYESLDLSRQFAQNMLNMAMQELEQARSNARAQHIYVTAFITPGLPQSAAYPKRITSVLLVGLGALLFWTIGLLIVGSVREHLT